MLGVILALLLLPFGPLAPACVAADCWDGSRLEICCVERSLRPVGTYFSADVCNAGLDMTGPTSIEWWATAAYNGKPERLLAVQTFEALAHTACRTVGIQADSGQNVWLRINARPFGPTVATWGAPCQATGGTPPWVTDPYRYAACNGTALRVYDGSDGYARWWRMAWTPGSEPQPGGWTDARLPWLGPAQVAALRDCRVMVRGVEGVLYLDYTATGWSLPRGGTLTSLPLVLR